MLAKWLIGHGISSATTEEVATLLGVPTNQVPQRLAALKRRGEIVSPAHGLWMPVPLEYSTWGAPPALEIIDDIMRHFQAQYYVGWLSAAELLGASHHAPQVFQVASLKAIRPRTVGRSRLAFYLRTNLTALPTDRVQVSTGTVPVSTRAVTMLDVVSDLPLVGGIDNAANIIIELSETSPRGLPIQEVVAISTFYPTSTLRRLGWLIERFVGTGELDSLRHAANSRTAAPSRLDPKGPRSGSLDRRWQMLVNREVVPDI
jgi:predicted transcriptional regulator of viral defense system